MRTFHVLYAGPALSGRATSLRVLCPPACDESGTRVSFGPWMQQLADGVDIALGSEVVHVRLAFLYLGSQWLPKISAARTSSEPWLRDLFARLVAFLPVLDGVIFVTDSQPQRTEANLEALELLIEFMHEQGIDPARVPFVFQLNKRDIPNVLRVDELQTILRTPRCAHAESIAVREQGVHQTLGTLLRLIDGDPPVP